MYLTFALSPASSVVVVDCHAHGIAEPGLQFFPSPHEYNVFATAHGLIMIFFMVMPAMIGGLMTVKCR